MSVGYALPFEAPHPTMRPRHPTYQGGGARSVHPWHPQQPGPQRYRQHSQGSYAMPYGLGPDHWYPPGDEGVYYRPLLPAHATAYHTPPLQQVPFYDPYFYGPPPLHPLALAPPAPNKEPVERKSIAEAFMDDASSACLRNAQLIHPSAAVIPPHPAIEHSAVPLSLVGADFVWMVAQDAMAKGKLADARAAPSSLAFQYGPIGGERALARQQAVARVGSPAGASLAHYSLSSAQQIVGPMTPPSSGQADACSLPAQYGSAPASPDALPWTKRYWDALASPESSPTANGRRPAPRPAPYDAFGHFVQNVLTVTLVTPQTLALALYYVCQACRDDAPVIHKHFSPRSAPYKLFVGALSLANKVLDDNSYRARTWSQVSAVPLKDVAYAEGFLLEAMEYDVALPAADWAGFTGNLVHSYGRTGLAHPDALRYLVDIAEARVP